MQGQLRTTSLTFFPWPLCFRFTSYYYKKKEKSLAFISAVHPLAFFLFFFSNHGYTGWHQRKQWIISFVCALDLSVVEGKMAFIVDCTFSPETCNKVIELENQEQNRNLVNNISVKFLSLFVILKMEAGENVTLLNRSFCLSFAFQSSVILRKQQWVLFQVCKAPSSTPSRMKQRIISKYFWTWSV